MVVHAHDEIWGTQVGQSCMAFVKDMKQLGMVFWCDAGVCRNQTHS